MDILGIGPLELILILILGFLFFGPEKLPGIAAKLGSLYRNFNRAANEMTNTLKREVTIEEEHKSKDISHVNPDSAEAPGLSSGRNPESQDNTQKK